MPVMYREPSIIKKSKDGRVAAVDMASELLNSRVLLLEGEVNDATCNGLIKSMLVLEHQSATEPITLIINSPGGSVTAGLALIPTLYYTYTGIWGDHVLWADAAIFYLSAAVTFWLDDLLHRQRRLWKMEYQVAGLVWLWVLAFLFVWWTFSPPHIALFRDPLTGLYGIP